MPPGESPEILERELAAAHRAGLTDLEIIPRAPISTFDTGPALRFPRQAQFHPLKYLAALAQAMVRDGGRIYTQTHATKIEGGEPARIETREGAVVTAAAVVVATNTPVYDWLAFHTKQAAYRTFVIGVLVPAGSISKGLYWDTPNPYHYVRLHSLAPGESAANGADLLIVGGEDHKTGQADDAEARYSRLEQWARERFPMMKEIKFRWSGQVMEPIDGPFIGRNPLDKKNVYVAMRSAVFTSSTFLSGRLLKLLKFSRAIWSDPASNPARRLTTPVGNTGIAIAVHKHAPPFQKLGASSWKKVTNCSSTSSPVLWNLRLASVPT